MTVSSDVMWLTTKKTPTKIKRKVFFSCYTKSFQEAGFFSKWGTSVWGFSMISSVASGRAYPISASVIFSCISLLFQIQYRCDFSSLIPKNSSVPSSVHTYCDVSRVSAYSSWFYVHHVTCKRVKTILLINAYFDLFKMQPQASVKP